MATPLPEVIRIKEFPGSVRFLLPRRRPWAGEGPVLRFLWTFFEIPMAFMWFLAIPFIRPVRLIQTVFTRTDLELTDHSIRTIIRFGPLRWVRKIGLERPDHFVVEETQEWWPGQADLTIVFEDGKVGLLLFAYPRQWVLPLADQLARRLASSDHRVSVVADRAPHVREKPSSSRAEVDESWEGFRVFLPPIGMTAAHRKNAPMLVFLGTLGPVFCACIAIPGFARSFILSQFVAFIGVLALILCWFTFFRILRVARSQVVIAVAHDKLTIEERSVLGRKERVWSRTDIADISVDRPSVGFEDLEYALQVQLRNGRNIELLVGRESGELEWLRSALSTHLCLPNF